MAFQDNRLSSVIVADHFLEPDDLETYPLLVYELGGVGLNDPSEGLRYQVWTLRYFPATDEFVLSAPNTAPTTEDSRITSGSACQPSQAPRAASNLKSP